MMWMSLYAAVAVIAAIAVSLLAERLRMPGVPAPDNPARYAVFAGLLWPVLILGIAQWGVIAMVASWLRRSARPVHAVSTRPVHAVSTRGASPVDSPLRTGLLA
jgi:hypothetical protein